jgi:hypothetical protein
LISAFFLLLAMRSALFKFSLVHRHNSKSFNSNRDFYRVASGSFGETLEKPPHARDSGLVIAGKGWVQGGKQLGFDDYELSTAKKRTKCEKFLAGMEKVVPWKAWSCRHASFDCPQIGVQTLQRVHPVRH